MPALPSAITPPYEAVVPDCGLRFSVLAEPVYPKVMSVARFVLPLSPPKTGEMAALPLRVMLPPPSVYNGLFCKAKLLLKASTPAVIEVVPLKVLMPERVNMPVPLLVSARAAVPPLISAPP